MEPSSILTFLTSSATLASTLASSSRRTFFTACASPPSSAPSCVDATAASSVRRIASTYRRLLDALGLLVADCGRHWRAETARNTHRQALNGRTKRSEWPAAREAQRRRAGGSGAAEGGGAQAVLRSPCSELLVVASAGAGTWYRYFTRLLLGMDGAVGCVGELRPRIG